MTYDRKPKLYPRGARLSTVPAGFRGTTWDKWLNTAVIEMEPARPAQAAAAVKFGSKKTA